MLVKLFDFDLDHIINYILTTSNIYLIAVSNNIWYSRFLSCLNHNGIASYIAGISLYIVQGII